MGQAPGLTQRQVPARVAAVTLTGHGGLDKLLYGTDVATPHPARYRGGPFQVAADAVNNTDINTLQQ